MPIINMGGGGNAEQLYDFAFPKDSNGNVIEIVASAFQDKYIETVNAPFCSVVGGSAFKGCLSLKKVNLKECITVGNYAFFSCPNLETVYMPKCETIGDEVFCYCASPELNLPNCISIGSSCFRYTSTYLRLENFSGTIMSGASSTGNYLSGIYAPKATAVSNSGFRSDINLSEAILDEVRSIGTNAFAYCSNLKSIYMPKCTYIGNAAFYSAPIEGDLILNDCTTVGQQAFYRCNIEKFVAPKCQYVSSYFTFCQCYSLKYVLLGSVSKMERLIFDQCSALEQLYMPAVTSISASASAGGIMSIYGYIHLDAYSGGINPLMFGISTNSYSNSVYSYFSSHRKLMGMEAKNLKWVEEGGFYRCYRMSEFIASNCGSIGGSAFYYCDVLSFVSIGASSIIRTYAFGYCKSLMKFVINPEASTIIALSASNAFTATPLTDSTYTGSYGSIYVASSFVEAYKSATNWAYFSDRITAYEEEPE